MLRHKGGLVAIDPKTGKPHWEEAFPRAADAYYASPVIAGGILYAAREDGVVFAAKIGDKFELLSENDMGRTSLAVAERVADEGVGALAADWVSPALYLHAEPGVLAESRGVIPKGKPRRGSGPTGVLPLGLGGQS